MRTLASAAILASLLCACTSLANTVPQIPRAPAADATRVDSLGVMPFNAPSSVFPGETTTEPTGIRPELISATVTLQGGATLGGLYKRKHQIWSQIAYPGAASTAAYGPETIPGGYRVVGSYKNSGQTGDNGFVYDSLTKQYLTIDAPANLCSPKACNYTIAHSVFGDKHYLVVGNYDAVSPSGAAAAATPPVAGHAFLYVSATKKFATIDIAGAISSTAYGIWIDGKTIAVAGGYTDKSGRHGFVRDLSSKRLVTYDYPLAALTHFEGIASAGGAGNYYLVGDFTKPRNKAVYGFFLEIRNWKPWPPIVIGKLSANSVSDRTVVGVYNPGSGISGFMTTIPIQDPP